MEQFKIAQSDPNILIALIAETYGEISSLRILYNDKIPESDHISIFILASITRIAELSLAMSRLTVNNMESIFILSRSLLEVKVDLLWFYSIFKNDKTKADQLAKRFFQLGHEKTKNFIEKNEHLYNNDIYLKKLKSKYEKQKRNYKKLELIELIDNSANKKLQYLQSINWRALPGLVKNPKDIQFRQRCAKAVEVAAEIFNLKMAPYQKNWEILNLFAHWNSIRMKSYDEEAARTFHCRTLNLNLGFLHDSINLGYYHIKLSVPPKLVAMREKFIYESL